MSIWARSTLLTWSPNVDNAPVDLQWKPQNASNWIEVNGITGGSYSLTGLTPNTFYDVRLQAVCSPTNRSGYPYTSSFSTAGIQYQLLTYADSITAQAAHLRRSTTSDDTPNLPYQFQWRVVGSSTWNTTGMLTAQSYLLTGLIANTTYEARGKLNEFDAGIKYGDVYTFTTYCRLPGDLTVSRIMAE